MAELEKDKKEQTPEDFHPLAHTYKGDMDKAMLQTDAAVVQAMMKDAQEREAYEKDERKKVKERGWYVLASIILALLALVALGYGIFYFKNLTVKVSGVQTVGIFPNTEAIFVDETNIKDLAKKLALESLPEKRPTLANLLQGREGLAQLTNEQFFSFIESGANEPFQNMVAVAKLGLVNIDEQNVPFVIMSVKNTELATKELLIAEPKLLDMFHQALNIDTTSYKDEVGKSFASSYVYNIPVRSLLLGESPIIFYGFVGDEIVVISTKYEVLKTLYDKIISQ